MCRHGAARRTSRPRARHRHGTRSAGARGPPCPRAVPRVTGRAELSRTRAAAPGRRSGRLVRQTASAPEMCSSRFTATSEQLRGVSACRAGGGGIVRAARDRGIAYSRHTGWLSGAERLAFHSMAPMASTAFRPFLRPVSWWNIPHHTADLTLPCTPPPSLRPCSPLNLAWTAAGHSRASASAGGQVGRLFLSPANRQVATDSGL